MIRNAHTGPGRLARPLVLGLGATLLLASLGPACGRRRAGEKGKTARRPSPPPSRSLLGPPLAGLVERVPADAEWAVVTRAFGPPADRIDELATLLADHPALGPRIASWRAHLEERLGLWPFDAAGRAALGLGPETAMALFRQPWPGAKAPVLGLVVLGTRPRTLVDAIATALRQRGRGQGELVRTHHRHGRLLLSFQDRWTCGYERGATRCAEVTPDRWPAPAKGEGPSLRSGPLEGLSDEDLSGDLGLYVQQRPDWPGWAQALLGERPQRMWGAMNLGPSPEVRAVLVTEASARARPAQPAVVPGPSTGLAVGQGAELLLRLRATPEALLAHLGRLGAPGVAAMELLGSARPTGPTTLAKALGGELVLVGYSDGLGAVWRLGDRAAAERALAALDVQLAGRLPQWQRKIRERGAGWDLSFEPLPAIGRGVRGLLLDLPTGRGAPFPALRGGRLRLIWGLSADALLAATDPIVFRRLLAGSTQPDAEFLGALHGANHRLAFASVSRTSLALQTDDPLAQLPAPQRDLLRGDLEAFGPDARSLITMLGVAGDLLSEISLSVRSHPAGTMVEAWLGLAVDTPLAADPGAPQHRASTKGQRHNGRAPWIAPPWREALRRKWGGNVAGYGDALVRLSRHEVRSWLRDKARRNHLPPDSPPHSGVTGLVAGVLVPLEAARRRGRWPKEALSRLGQLGESLRALASAASTLPRPARQRWHRGLTSTPLTPPRSCCAAPDRQCRSEARDWWHPTWKRLGFQIETPHRYRYAAGVTRASVRTRIVFSAEGDLDCDGISSRLELAAEVDERTGELTLGKIREIRRETPTAP